MFRFTIRDWLWLMVVVVVGTTLFVMPSRRENGQRTATRSVSEQELETIRVRYEAAKGEFDFHVARTMGSGVWPSADEYCGAIERFALAAEARDDLETRVKDLAEALKFAQQKVSSTLDKYEADVYPANEVYRFQYTRADIEARLRRAEQDLAASQVTR
jgi:hypothetical protein